MAEPLKVKKTLSIHVVDRKELERFASQVYNLRGYSFSTAEWPDPADDEDVTFTVSPLTDSAQDDDADDIAMIKNGVVPRWRNALLLDLLCTDGCLAPGHYLVEAPL